MGITTISKEDYEADDILATLATHEIVMRDEQGRRLSTVRMTNFLRDA
jgi:hypothetical protein